MRGELKQIESTFDKAAALLKEDVEDSIRLLERTKGKRKLTKEEDLIIDRFRQNLGDVKDVMHKEIAEAEEVVSGKKKVPRKKKVIETIVTESEITE